MMACKRRALHSEWGLRTASQRRWHLGECVYIICFTFMQWFWPLQNNKSRHFAHDIRSRKEREMEEPVFPSCQQQASESSVLLRNPRCLARRLRGVCQLVVLSPLTSALNCYPHFHWGIQQPCDFGGEVSGVYKSVCECDSEILAFLSITEKERQMIEVFSSACVCVNWLYHLFIVFFLEEGKDKKLPTWL